MNLEELARSMECQSGVKEKGFVVSRTMYDLLLEELENPVEDGELLLGFEVRTYRSWPKGYIGILDADGKLYRAFRLEDD